PSRSASRSCSATSAASPRSPRRARRAQSARTPRSSWRPCYRSCSMTTPSAQRSERPPRPPPRAPTRGTRSRGAPSASTVTCSMAELLDDLIELLRIPSVSAGRPNQAGLRQAAEWVKARVERAGGEAELTGDSNPLVTGELRANRPDAPDVLVYGHYDVQDVGPADEWLSDPFEPDIRDGRIYARGASDDKGNFLPVLHVACEMHAAGELPVNVRVAIEGEEEKSSAQV